jgi:uncharacterized protein YndB with AHSA1/START domain
MAGARGIKQSKAAVPLWRRRAGNWERTVEQNDVRAGERRRCDGNGVGELLLILTKKILAQKRIKITFSSDHDILAF